MTSFTDRVELASTVMESITPLTRSSVAIHMAVVQLHYTQFKSLAVSLLAPRDLIGYVNDPGSQHK